MSLISNKKSLILFTCDNFTLSGLFHFFFHFFYKFLSCFLLTFFFYLMLLPTTVGDVAGLVVDEDGLVPRDVGESDVVVRLVIPG